MNKYPIFIGLIVGLVMVGLAPNPLWWAIVVLGTIANGLVVAVNGWKMPVRGAINESVRHAPMTSSTRLKWLGDIIPTGFGKASVGDIILAAGILGGWATRGEFTYVKMIALACFAWWGSGWAKGFVLLEKWTAEARRDCRKNIPIVLVLMLIGNFLNVRGCSVGELKASVNSAKSQIMLPLPKAKPQPRWRDLGNLAAPNRQFMTRLRKETAKQEREDKKQQAIKWKALTEQISSNQLVFWQFSVTQKSSRRGPFCRVTCAAHHGGQYDVETMPDFCRENVIPSTANYVPGWIEVSKDEEMAKPWPGPTDEGFEHYKLYWSDLQSQAKVIHRSGGEGAER